MRSHLVLSRLVLSLGISVLAAMLAVSSTVAEEGVLVASVAPDGARVALRTARFETVADAARVASGGRIELPRTATMSDLVEVLQTFDLTDSDSGSSFLPMSTIIGIDWDGSGFSGSSFIWSAPNASGCADGSVFTANSMPSGWNNRVSSAQAFGGCDEYRHYDLTGQSGSSINCTCSSMGFMDDRTSSERWAP